MDKLTTSSSIHQNLPGYARQFALSHMWIFQANLMASIKPISHALKLVWNMLTTRNNITQRSQFANALSRLSIPKA